MKFTLLILFLLPFIFSFCQQKQERAEMKSNNIDSVEVKKHTSGNPDTALAVFLYENYNNNNYAGYYDEYQRWVLDYNIIKPLILNLYQNDPKIDSVMSVLEAKKVEIIKLSRDYVIEVYEESNDIPEPDFEFLCQIKDETAKKLIAKIKTNPKVSDGLKEYVIELEDQYFK